MWTALLICGGLWAAAVYINRRCLRTYEDSGDPAAGIVIFVEPVRWLFIIWGFTGFCRGLRRANGEHRVVLFRWSTPAGALLVIPDLIGRQRLNRRAARLAHLIDRIRLTHPNVPVHIVSYSTGTYVALEACKRLGWPDSVSRLILLAPSASPRYDWRGLDRSCTSVHSFHSLLDAINIVGPLLFGANDRRWGPAGGAVGFRRAPDFVHQRAWRFADVRVGYFGDHFTIAAPAFIARHVAPLLANR